MHEVMRTQKGRVHLLTSAENDAISWVWISKRDLRLIGGRPGKLALSLLSLVR